MSVTRLRFIVQHSDIEWSNCCLECVTLPNVRIFRSELKRHPNRDEKAIVDNGYSEEKCWSPNHRRVENRKLYEIQRENHEYAHKRLKQFNVLGYRFIHKASLHGIFYCALSQIKQLTFEEHPLLVDTSIGEM